MTAQKKAAILKKITDGENLPSLSPLAVKLIELAADDHASASDLAQVIEKDPSLTTRLLKLVGSVFFRGLEGPTSVTQAVVRLGFKRVRVMALSLSLRDTFPMDQDKGMDYPLFWKASLYRATIASDFARTLEIVAPEEAFVTGLILEIGMLMLFGICDEADKKAFPGKDVSLDDALAWEESRLGIHHRDLGNLVLRRWNLPESVVNTQKCYGPQALQPEASPLCRVVELARQATEVVCSQTADLHQFQQTAQNALSLQPDTTNTLLVSALGKVEQLAEQLLVKVDSHADKIALMEKANRTLARLNRSMENSIQGLLEDMDQFVAQSEKSAQTCREVLQNTLDAVAHEVHNPLTAIGGFAKRLAEEVGDNHRGKEYARIIATEVLRLEQVLKEMESYCREYEPTLKDRDLVPVVGKVLDDLEEKKGRKTIQVVRHLPQPGPSAPLDVEGFGRALSRLLENAFDTASRDGTRVTLSVEAIPETREVSIKIGDNGKPFPSHVRDALLDSNLSAKAFSKGLGLPLAKKIIEAHNGRIALDAQEGRGNTISVYLPAS